MSIGKGDRVSFKSLGVDAQVGEVRDLSGDQVIVHPDGSLENFTIMMSIENVQIVSKEGIGDEEDDPPPFNPPSKWARIGKQKSPYFAG